LTAVSDLKTKIFADGADLDGITSLVKDTRIRGVTTNPTLMRQAGVTDYKAFAHKVLEVVPELPVSFEVFADDLPSMQAQALEIASWGKNVNVKIPVTNSEGLSTLPIIEALSAQGVQVNVTAVFTLDQTRQITEALSPDTFAIISIFAGRIADTGLDPMPLMREAVQIMKAKPKAELIWASPRELLNIFQADEVGCHIITVGHDVLGKLGIVGKDHTQYSLETVQMFRRDAQGAGYEIDV
jgi:transaldolase